MHYKALKNLIEAKKAKVGVIGLGYVGLPLVRLFASKGFDVTGFDIDNEKVRKLLSGRSYIKSVDSDTIKKLLKTKRFHATSDFRRLKDVDAMIICVPTPLTEDGRPDLSFIKSTATAIAKNMRKGQLVILESTTYPGTTREIMLPQLNKTKQKIGVDYFLAFSPEREDPGNKNFSNETIPKVVGGMESRSSELAALLYSKAVVKVVRVSSCEVAEACKILENVYRCVNIALVNELKIVFDKMGINVWEVISAASTKPFGFQPFYPGPGLGGHCIPIDPFYLSWKAKEYQTEAQFIELAGRVNVQMPYYVVGKLEEALKARKRRLEKSHILILGIAYKKDIDDPRESPAFKVIELLLAKGANVIYNDPYIPKWPKMRHFPFEVLSAPLTAQALRNSDAVVIVTDHTDYNYQWICENARLVIDTRNATRDVKIKDGKIVRA